MAFFSPSLFKKKRGKTPTLLVLNFAGLKFRVFRDCKKIAKFNSRIENSKQN